MLVEGAQQGGGGGVGIQICDRCSQQICYLQAVLTP